MAPTNSDTVVVLEYRLTIELACSVRW